jgi:hypothetical protein
MTVQALADALSLTCFHLAQPDRAVTGAYCGDLLSWVMGRAQADSVWLTIMSNGNVAGVASLADVSCVLLTEGVRPDADLLSKAQTHEVNLLGCDDSTFQAALRVAQALGDAP